MRALRRRRRANPGGGGRASRARIPALSSKTSTPTTRTGSACSVFVCWCCTTND